MVENNTVDNTAEAIVVDISGGWVKSGFSGDDCPKSDTNFSRAIADFSFSFAKITKDELRIAPEEHPVLVITSVSDLHKDNISTLSTALYGSFNAPAVCFASSGAMALYTCGKVTGVAVHIEEDILEVSAHYEGTLIDGAVKLGRITGKDAVINQGVLYESICEVIKDVVSLCDSSLRKDLLGNIVFAGRLENNIPLPGDLSEKTSATLSKYFGGSIKKSQETLVNEVAYLCWIGGSIATASDNFMQMWIDKTELDVYGVSVFDKRWLC